MNKIVSIIINLVFFNILTKIGLLTVAFCIFFVSVAATQSASTKIDYDITNCTVTDSSTLSCSETISRKK